MKKVLKSKKRNKKIMITDVAISKVPFIRYKEIDKKEHKHLQYLAQQVLIYSKINNKSNEVAIVYKLGENEFDFSRVGIAYGKEHDVDPLSSTNAYHLVKTSKECVIVCLHNHPSDSIISLMDIMFLILYENIKMVVVVTNSGNINYMVKGKKYSKKKASLLCSEAIEKSNKSRKIGEKIDAVKYFIKKCKTARLIYNIGRR